MLYNFGSQISPHHGPCVYWGLVECSPWQVIKSRLSGHKIEKYCTAEVLLKDNKSIHSVN